MAILGNIASLRADRDGENVEQGEVVHVTPCQSPRRSDPDRLHAPARFWDERTGGE